MNTEYYKTKLEKELLLLTKELESIGRINPNNPQDWEPLPQNVEVSNADENELADTQEGFEENTAILKELEIRFNNVKDALKRIGDDKYGVCENCDSEISSERLEANSASKTCVDCLAK
jgi:DnaK suppressor protein